MKNTLKLLGIVAVAVIIGFSVSSCGEPGSKVDPAANRISYVSGIHELVIEKDPNRSAFSPLAGDSYKLLANNIPISWGKLSSIVGSLFTFTPAVDATGALPFTATKGTVGGSEGLSITGNTVTPVGGVAVTISPMTWGPAGNWKGNVTFHDNTTLEVNLEVKGTSVNGTWELDTGDSGTYTAEGNTFVVVDSGVVSANAKLINNNTIEVKFTSNSYFKGTSTFTRQ